MTLSKGFDCIILFAIRRRLARYRRPRDGGDSFAEGVIAVLSKEIERRNRLLDGWDIEFRQREAAAAERRLRAKAVEQFQQIGSEPDEGLRLQ